MKVKKLIKELRSSHQKKETENKTFKISIDVIKKFDKKCRKNDLKLSHVVERLMEEFIKK